MALPLVQQELRPPRPRPRGGRSRLLTTVVALFGTLMLARSQGLGGATPELVIQETALRTIDTVELFRNGLYWWTASACSGDVINSGGAAYLAYTDPRILSSAVSTVTGALGETGGFHPGDAVSPGLSLTALKSSAMRGVLLPQCDYGAYFVRDDEAFYYAKNRALYRKSLTASAFAEGEPIRYQIGLERFPVSADGVLFVTANDVWSYAADLAASTLRIVRTWKSGSRDLRQMREVVTLPGVSVRKFTVADIQATDGSYLGSELIILLPNGELYRAGVTGGVAQRIRGGVQDFALRQESYTVVGNLGLTQRRRATTLYLAAGSSLIGFDLTPGARGSFDEDPGDPNFRVTSVAVDTRRIFLTRTPGSGQANSELRRRNAPAETTLRNPGDPDYATVGVSREFRSLRSTGRLVYFTHGNTVQRLDVGASAIDVDFEAYGVEAVQAIQNFNNTVPLVAGREVVVRGYARLAANSTGRSGFDVPAHLRVYHAPKVSIGQAVFEEVPGSPLLPVQAPLVTTFTNLAAARANLGATYQFQVPETMITEGDLRFEFALNPGLTVPETGERPLANNTAVATLTSKESIVLPLTMVPVRFGGGFYDPHAPGSAFWEILARARTLLPFARFQVFLRSPGVSKSVPFASPRSFDLPAEDSAALSAVEWARNFDSDPRGGPYVGMIPPLGTTFNGIGRRPGQAMVVRMTGEQGNPPWAPWNSQRGGISLAHEFCHNTGFRHFRNLNCGTIPLGSDQTTDVVPGNYDGYPSGADACTLGLTDLNDPATAQGFDPISWTVVPPAINGELMSYSTNRWISEYNWTRLYEIHTFRSPPFAATRALAGEGPRGPVVLVQGEVKPAANSATLLPMYTLSAAELSPAILAELTEVPADLPTDHPYRIRFLDDAGTVLTEHLVPLLFGDDATEPVATLRRALPLPETARRVVFVNGDAVLAEITISAAAPVVELDPPRVENGELQLSWRGSDPDGDPLQYSVQLSADDGQTWRAVCLDEVGTGLALATRELPGGASMRVRVLATDGVRSTLAASATFALPKHPPRVRIVGLTDGQAFDFGTALNLEGFGYDVDDGSLEAAALTWTLEGPEPRQAVGGTLPLPNLPPGNYILTLVGKDSDGEIGTEQRRFEIRPFAVAEGATPVLDGLGADEGYRGSPALRMATSNGRYATARFVHTAGALYVSFSGLRYAANSVPGAVAGLRVNTGESGPGVVTSVGFAVSENGEPLRVVGEGTRFDALAEPPPGFSVVIQRDENAWSAEMRIADALLGLWKEQLGLVTFFDAGDATTPPETWPPKARVDDPASWSPGVSAPGPDAPLVTNGSFENTAATHVPDALGRMSIPLPGTSANLLPGGDAEGIDGGNGNGPADGPLPGWVVQGTMTVTAWGTPGGWPTFEDPGPDSRGVNFFSGGRDTGDTTTATVVIPLPSAEWRIDGGQVQADLSGWFGGFADQADTAWLTATFQSATGQSLGSMTVGQPTPEARLNRTALLFDQATQIVPAGARSAAIVLTMKRAATVGFNDGYADNLFFGLRESEGASPIPGWSVVGAEITWAMNGQVGGPNTPFGAYFVDLTGVHDSEPYGGVSQVIPTVPGRNYALSFALGSFEGDASTRGPVAVEASVDADARIFTTTAGGVGEVWQTFRLPFVAATASTRLTFRGVASAGGTFLGVDDVAVVPADPEPVDLVITGVEQSQGQLILRFSSVAGRTYQVETGTDVSGGGWTGVPGTERLGDGSELRVSWPLDTTEGQRFYRLRSN